MSFPYKIVYSNRKTLALSVKTDASILVRSPSNIPRQRIDAFIEKKTNWLEKTLEKVKLLYCADFGFFEGRILRYLGDEYVLRFSEEAFAGVRIEGSSLLVSIWNALIAEEIVRRWYMDAAREIVLGRVSRHAEVMDLSYNKVKLSHARRSWGCCTSKRNLLFSWRLVQFSLPVIDYVIIHELGHLLELNHSKNFWNIVKKYCPDYKEKRIILKQRDPNLLT